MRRGTDTIARRTTRPTQPLAHSIQQAAQLIGIGSTSMAELVRTGQLPSFTIGRRRLIAADDLAAFVHQCRAQARKRIGPVPQTPLGGDRPTAERGESL